MRNVRKPDNRVRQRSRRDGDGGVPAVLAGYALALALGMGAGAWWVVRQWFTFPGRRYSWYGALYDPRAYRVPEGRSRSYRVRGRVKARKVNTFHP